MQTSLCFLAARPLQPLMYESVLSRGCNMYGLCSSHHYVVPVVMLSIVKQEYTTESVQVWNPFCQPLSAKPGWQQCALNALNAA